MTPRLTKRQREVLAIMDGRLHDGYEQHVYVYTRDNGRLIARYEPEGSVVSRRIIRALRCKGAVECIGIEPDACYYRITEAGRKALEEGR